MRGLNEKFFDNSETESRLNRLYLWQEKNETKLTGFALTSQGHTNNSGDSYVESTRQKFGDCYCLVPARANVER